MTKELAGRIAIVTGAAHGLGRAMCVALAERGAAVWACDVRERELAGTAQALGATAAGGGRTARVDATDPAQVTEFVRRVAAEAGDAEILVNCAGGVADQTPRPVEDVSDEDWHRIFRVNLDAAFHFTRAVVPGMKRRGRGAIVNISSGAGRSYSQTGIQAYASAKAGVIGFTRQTARELGRFGIRVNSVAPGFVLSNPATERQWAALGEQGQKRLLDSIAMGRLGQPHEIASVVAFLVSDGAAYVTGQTLGADGGHWMLG
jgi:3-oxoacyl-[acyl-carrier protein] reductase